MNILKSIENEVRTKFSSEPAHDFNHIKRVYNNAKMLASKEKGNTKLVLTAALLHDIVTFPKSDPRNKNASTKSAQYAAKVLKKYPFTENEIKIICEAIKEHSFSKNKTPSTIEGKILQDADRLDALGAIGIARVFSVSGSEKRSFYSNLDPFCSKRNPDDKKWAIDHFYRKLLKLEKLMNTKTGKIEAKRRTKILNRFLADFKREIHP